MKASPSFPIVGRRVLLVEDEQRLREMLTRAVREMDFEISATPSAEAALRLLENHCFDIAIVDLNLPGMHGLSFLEMAHKRWPMLQSIILTGFGDLDAARKAIRIDAVDFLTKPAPLGELELALGRARARLLQQMPVEPPPPDPDEEADMEAHASRETLEQIERQHILVTLQRNNGNRTQTAAELGISLRKLYYRLGQYQRQGLLSGS
ncbi:MAG TPA: response regulator [Tepidisphaeraceae bacterium]|jgi:DNA-binding NtrC family response regulator|nr:response regulator [Tepidisphaeraceae bacterium]